MAPAPSKGDETVKVIVRCRPMNSREKQLKCDNIISMDGSAGQVGITNPQEKSSPPKMFTFDASYFIDSTTEQIYADVAYPLVDSVTDGFNATIFAYGQTGCGKSFSMQGIKDPPSQSGIIPRSFNHIFETISVTEESKFLVHASYIEIYNEEIRDLLGKDVKHKLDLKESPQKGVYIQGLSMHPVHNVSDCEGVMEKGWENRSVGATLMNAESSRSHSIFTVFIERTANDATGGEHIRAGKLNLVDLAGSERQSKTGSSGARFKEATKINLSLSALGNVISALVDGKSSHIPYRDSKLTRLLQDSLGGNTKTLMVAAISPASDNYDETLSTLRYANRAKNIKNKPKINEDPKDTLLRQYQEEIEKLKTMLAGQGPVPEGQATVDPEEQKRLVEAEVAKEKEKLRKEHEGQMEDLKKKYEMKTGEHKTLEKKVKELEGQYQARMKAVDVKAGGGSGKDMLPLTSQAIAQDDAIKRLQELQDQIVGGEQANNEELKKKRKQKLTHAEKVRARIAEAISKMDDDGIMLQVYDNMQEDVKAKNQLLVRARQKIHSLEAEIKDLQSEFEFDRIDYLDTIRKQDQQLKLCQQLLEKVQPCLRKDCNYSNIDQVMKQATWSEDLQRWALPELTMQKTNLPPAAGLTAGGRQGQTFTNISRSPASGLFTAELPDFDDTYIKHLQQSDAQQRAEDYFKPTRDIRTIYGYDQKRFPAQDARTSPFNTSPTATSTLPGIGAKPTRLDPLQDLTNKNKRK